MSELKTNKISPATGTDVTLGDVGDTFTIPSGTTIVNNGTATNFGGVPKVLQFLSLTNNQYSATTSSNVWQVTHLKLDVTPSSTDSKIFIMYDITLYTVSSTYGTSPATSIFRGTDGNGNPSADLNLGDLSLIHI